MDITFRPAQAEDAAQLVDIQNKAFAEDYFKYGECPGYGRSAEQMRESMQRNTQFVICADGAAVGKVSAHMLDENTAHLDCLCVVPEYEHRGIGRRGVEFIETQFDRAAYWTLETPADKVRNVRFYTGCGYEVVDARQDGSVTVDLFRKCVSK